MPLYLMLAAVLLAAPACHSRVVGPSRARAAPQPSRIRVVELSPGQPPAAPAAPPAATEPVPEDEVDVDCSDGTCRIRRRKTGAIVGEPGVFAPPRSAPPATPPPSAPSEDVRILAACVKAVQVSVQALADAIDRLPTAVAAAMREIPKAQPPPAAIPPKHTPTKSDSADVPAVALVNLTLFAVIVLLIVFSLFRRKPHA